MQRQRLFDPYAGIAQLVERNLAKVEVASSNLVSRSSHSKREACASLFCPVYRPDDRFQGAVAKRLCTGLQIRVGRFDSGPRLVLPLERQSSHGQSHGRMFVSGAVPVSTDMPSQTIDSLIDRLLAAVPGNWEKVIATVLLVVLALLLSYLWSRYLARGEISPHKRRLHLVWARNLIWLVTLLVIISVWASTIAGFALSLAAVAGALLIVSKELVMCVHGYLYVTLVQPFKVGDVIEFGQMRGRVIDIDMFATTLIEIDAAAQVTGSVVEFPNGMLLTMPLRNISPTEGFLLQHVRIPVPAHLMHDLDLVEQAALAAADQVTSDWRQEAMAHFRKVSATLFIDFPSGKSKVSWDFSDPDHLILVLRVACPAEQRANVGQAVFRETWRRLAAADKS
jgi:small-conductance mechanosensitive channel